MIFYLLFIISLVLPAFAQTSLIELQRKIEQLEKEITLEKKQHQQEKTQHQGFLKQKENKDKHIKDKIDEIQQNNDSLIIKSKEIQQQKKYVLSQIQKEQSTQKKLLKEIEIGIQKWRERLQHNFLYHQKEYSQEFEKLALKIKKTPLDKEKILNKYYEISLQLIEQGRSINQKHGTYTSKQNKTFDGTYFQIGNVISFFISDNQKFISYLDYKNNTYQWRENLSRKEKKEILTSLKVISGKTPPKLVTLPVHIKEEINEN